MHQLITKRKTESGDIKEELSKIGEIGKTFMPKKHKAVWQKFKNFVNRYRYQYSMRG